MKTCNRYVRGRQSKKIIPNISYSTPQVRQFSPSRPVSLQPNEEASPVPIGAVNSPVLIQEVERNIRLFNDGKIPKSVATARLAFALGFTQERDSAKERALQSYIEQLDDIERTQHRASRQQHLSNIPETPKTPEVATRSPISIGSAGRSRSVASSSQSTTTSSDQNSTTGDSGDERPRKRSKLLESDMPFYEEEMRFRKSGNPSCAESARLINLYAVDPAQVKQWISTSARAPHGFPPSEWDHIIRGKPVNLDVVMSSLFQCHPVEESRGRIGDSEISLGFTKPTVKVETHGNWTSAWNTTVRAYDFLFPHRHDELTAYGADINDEFAARRPEYHHKVIRFDKAVRNEVGGGVQVLLTDTEKFAKLRAAILSADGIFSSFDANNSRRKSTDICIRFNRETGCPNSVRSCKYKHICSKCKQDGHGAQACQGKK